MIGGCSSMLRFLMVLVVLPCSTHVVICDDFVKVIPDTTRTQPKEQEPWREIRRPQPKRGGFSLPAPSRARGSPEPSAGFAPAHHQDASPPGPSRGRSRVSGAHGRAAMGSPEVHAATEAGHVFSDSHHPAAFCWVVKGLVKSRGGC